MSALQALVLGLIQGVTEFLPISSSAHLILVPWLTGWPDQGLTADVAANTGTLVAVATYFRHDLARFVRAFVARLRSPRSRMSPDERLMWMIGLGTIPVALSAFLFYDTIATRLRSPIVIAWTSIGFGLLLGIADRFGTGVRQLSQTTLPRALAIGVSQAFALVPGTSRSGVTMTSAMALGFDRESAARLSFLFAIPVSLLAAANDGAKLLGGGVPRSEWLGLGIVFVTSAVVAYLVIGWLLHWLRQRGMTPFVIYRLVLGALILVASPWL